MVSVPSFFFIPVTGVQVHCTLTLSILVHHILLGICTPKHFLRSHSGHGLPLVPLWLNTFVSYADIVFCAYLKFFCRLHMK